jgi:hypothetical protein
MSTCFSPLFQIQIPLEDLEAYGSDSGSGGHASNSVDKPKTPQYDTDANATEAESNDGRSEEQKFDGQSDSDQHTPAQKSKRRFSPDAQSQTVAGCSDSDDNARVFSERDELVGHSGRGHRRGFKRPRIQWERGSSWNKDHVSPDDYQGEIARIMAKSMHDAKTEVTPKYNARAISDFRLKTVRYCRFVCNEMHCI